MLIPSLPPDLKPWMMRPRAGQRNSGDTPAASAWLPVRTGPGAGSSAWTLPVGAVSAPGFLLIAAAGGGAISALATTSGLVGLAAASGLAAGAGFAAASSDF